MTSKLKIFSIRVYQISQFGQLGTKSLDVGQVFRCNARHFSLGNFKSVSSNQNFPQKRNISQSSIPTFDEVPSLEIDLSSLDIDDPLLMPQSLQKTEKELIRENIGVSGAVPTR